MKIRKFCSDEGGLTYVDILIYMAVILILSIPAYQLISRTLKGYESYRNRAEISRNKILLYASLRHELAMISPPWWAPLEEAVKDSEGYSFSWYDGDEDNTLILKNGDKGFYIITLIEDDTETRCYIPGYSLENLEIYTSPDEISSGWLLEFSNPITDELEFHIPMSRIAL